MNYEVKDTNWLGVPKVNISDSTKIEVYVNVTTGIVGQTYKGFNNTDSVLMTFSITMTGSDMQISTATQASAYVAVTYPNI